jgi:hypothetical protein
MAAQVGLKLIGEKTLHHGANPLLLAYCPSMELLALGSSDQQVSLYRLNGQRIYSVAQKGTPLTVDRISWKPNGKPSKCFDEFVTDTPKVSYLQLLGVMVSCDSSELRAAKLHIRFLLDPMEQPVSRVLVGNLTLSAKGARELDLLKTDPLGKTYLKRHLMGQEIEINLICLEILP